MVADVCKRSFGAVSSAIWEDEEAVGAVVVAGAVEVLAVVALVVAGAVLAVVLAEVVVLAVEARAAVGDRRLGHRWTRINTNQNQMSAIMFLNSLSDRRFARLCIKIFGTIC